MTKPRKQLISLDETPYYHCISRCVRSGFLCGSSGNQSFEHRRGWIVDRIKQLSGIFTIDIAAYAVMSNHYHIVIHIDAKRATELPDTEVIERWLQLFKAPPKLAQHLATPLTSKAELDVITGLINKWRARLCDISWFMRTLNEYIARLANEEDHCSGHFWESRFKSQALLGEAALLSCMAYVDLNPIRASMAQTPAESDYTSIQERLGITPECKNNPTVKAEKNRDSKQSNINPLMPFSDNIKNDTPSHYLPFNYADYLDLVDWTGRAVREDKHGYIPESAPSILAHFELDPDKWLTTCSHIERNFYLAVGPVEKLQEFATKIGQRWMKGLSSCRIFHKTC